jgi:hypothetical protein
MHITYSVLVLVTISNPVTIQNFCTYMQLTFS